MNFNKQFSFKPVVANSRKLGRFDKFIIAGMGGSHLAADLLPLICPGADVSVYKEYGFSRSASDALFIASSYSGNTEETIDAFIAAGKAKFNRAVMASGGKLLEIAKSSGVPYVQLPSAGIQPRMAVGYGLTALLALMRKNSDLRRVAHLASALSPQKLEKQGRELSEKLKGSIPVIYSSSRNAALACNWKIKFNETGKVPAFCNVLPELNHNEMTGFDFNDYSKKLSDKFHFIFLKDASDHPRVIKRMDILETLLSKRGFPVEVVAVKESDACLSVFFSLILADWTAYYTALANHADPESVPMVEEFKKLMLS